MKNSSDIFIVEPTAEYTRIKIVGNIDASVDFPQITLVAGQLLLDLESFHGISSIGIRRWILWLDSLRPKHLILEKCSKPFVDQMNNVQHFVPRNCTVKSFYVPYYSPMTEGETQVLYEHGVNYATQDAEISHPWVLDAQNNAMEIDVHPDRYFRFLKTSPSSHE